MRGQIIIIGATNRVDSIDPALRRPGRFDRELVFNLPSRKARKQILSIHTREWWLKKKLFPSQKKKNISNRQNQFFGAMLTFLEK